MEAVDAPDPADRNRRPERRARRGRRRSFGLRTRILATFGLGSLVLSTFLALSTYNFTRSNLVNERESTAITKVYQEAGRLQSDLTSNPTNVQAAIQEVRDEAGSGCRPRRAQPLEQLPSGPEPAGEPLQRLLGLRDGLRQAAVVPCDPDLDFTAGHYVLPS